MSRHLVVADIVVGGSTESVVSGFCHDVDACASEAAHLYIIGRSLYGNLVEGIEGYGIGTGVGAWKARLLRAKTKGIVESGTVHGHVVALAALSHDTVVASLWQHSGEVGNGARYGRHGAEGILVDYHSHATAKRFLHVVQGVALNDYLSELLGVFLHLDVEMCLLTEVEDQAFKYLCAIADVSHSHDIGTSHAQTCANELAVHVGHGLGASA